MSSSAEAIRAAVRPAARRVAALATARWEPRSRLFLVGEDVGWVIDHELRQVAGIAGRLGVRVAPRRLLNASSGQAAFYGSQFALLREPWRPAPHALATAYFHGRPGTPGEPAFDTCYEALRARHHELHRVQVSHSEIHELVLSSGIEPAKVFRIPIGVDVESFRPPAAAAREAARTALGLPRDAFVVGSFHKDGVGFDDGSEPKAIKGPDILLEALRLLMERVPELHVLLTGPARTFVRRGLERLGIPYRHRLVERYEEIGRLYHGLDAYVVPSRQEGGPKGVLEAMASGVPVVTTRVGQAMDLVRHGENGWLVDVEDAEGLAYWLGHIASRPVELETVLAAGLETAWENSYEAQVPLWRSFFDGFVRLRA
jgi:glycosyltransferase involved in cell wall biosynthesis